MTRIYPLPVILLSFTAFVADQPLAAIEPKVTEDGTKRAWQPLSLTFEGPTTSENATPNPFSDYRFEVTFTLDQYKFSVPGFFAADGDAANSGATQGNQWRVFFTPPKAGKWEYKVAFVSGQHVAVSSEPGTPVDLLHGYQGTIEVGPPDLEAVGFYKEGTLVYSNSHYLHFSGSGKRFLKAGADSPENLLGYVDFDGTPKGKHRYEPHAKDWQPGNPTWADGRGKNLIGALNYLASKNMNSVYFLTMNVKGDGKDVWPWVSDNVRDRFDCSKLDQWEIVFSHMDRLGLMLHVITQEQENDQLLNNGKLGLERKLYYRELVARFAHHLAIVWNLGEENTNTDQQRKQFATYIRNLDPYNHPIVVHTFPSKYDEVYKPLLGFKDFEGPSLQTNDTHRQTLKWRELSAKADRPWVVCLDEIGPAHTGVKPDADDYWHDEVRAKHLWGNLLAGGAGVEWYFGYKFAHNDLNLEDWRSRDHLWDLTKYAVEFCQQLPLEEMEPNDSLIDAKNAYCLAQVGKIYAVYLPQRSDKATLDLRESHGTYSVQWFNPREGGNLQSGSITSLQGPGRVKLGEPPVEEKSGDWVVLVKFQSTQK